MTAACRVCDEPGYFTRFVLRVMTRVGVLRLVTVQEPICGDCLDFYRSHTLIPWRAA
jgi:hypothetical protein